MKKVLIQMGHVAPRDPNHLNETGAAGEQELVMKIGPKLARLINAHPGMEAILVPGHIPSGIRCDAAIFLHGDGSANPATRGYSYGYPVHPVNKSLRDMLQWEYVKIPDHPPFFRDNYTGGLRGYYGYSRVNTAGPEVLVEHGFLSNPKDRAWMFANVNQIANAHFVALRRYFGLTVIPKPPPKETKFVVIFRKADGRVFRTAKAKWPRLAIAGTDLAKNKITRIDIKHP